jgi:hypothetical protein
MLNITLDSQILFDILEQREDYLISLELKKLFDLGIINLRVTASSGSENRKDKQPVRNIQDFMKMLNLINLNSATILDPIMYWGISFWGHALNASEEMIKVEKELFEILHDVPHNYKEYCLLKNIDSSTTDPKWRNKLCDTQVIWCHIWYQGDVFITRDKNFHKQTKKPKLIELGAKNIMYPEEALNYILNLNDYGLLGEGSN